MQLQILGKKRKDGKYKILLSYKGSPNMFGGFYPTTFFRKLLTPIEVFEYLDSVTFEQSYDCDDFLNSEVRP